MKQVEDKKVMSLSIDSKVPDFRLPDSRSKKVSLSEVATEARVVLVFYRGYW
jgi:peroxiredoxin